MTTNATIPKRVTSRLSSHALLTSTNFQRVDETLQTSDARRRVHLGVGAEGQNLEVGSPNQSRGGPVATVW